MSEEKTTEKTTFKAKWDNYWYYYKVHTWIGIFILIVMIFSITQCVQTVKPDVSIDVVSTGALTESYFDPDEYFSDTITDINGDGKKHIILTSLYISADAKSEQDIAMQQKMMIELAAGDVTLFLFDKDNLDRYLKQDAYAPLSDFLDLSPYEGEEGKLVEQNGIPVAISLKGSAKLSEMGFLSDDLYAAFHFVPEKSKNDEKKMAEFENAAAVLKELLK